MTEEAEESKAGRREDPDEAPDIFGRPLATAPVDRASESSLSPPSLPPPKQTTAISSGPFEVAPASLGAPAEEHVASPVSLVPSPVEPPVSIASAMGRDRDVVPLSRIIGIGAAIFVLLVGLSLLLFR